jgi:thiol-disulfide isomerase/thioredoxin
VDFWERIGRIKPKTLSFLSLFTVRSKIFILAFVLLLPLLPAAQLRVVLFMAPQCKICQYYSLTLRQLYEQYSTKGVHFEAFMPGEWITDSIADAYQTRFRLPFDVNPDQTLHYELGATAVPEVFLLDEDGKVLYHGRIDDSYEAIGKRRTHVKHHELKNALDDALAQRMPSVPFVQPVGCIIEKKSPQ